MSFISGHTGSLDIIAASECLGFADWTEITHKGYTGFRIEEIYPSGTRARVDMATGDLICRDFPVLDLGGVYESDFFCLFVRYLVF